MQIPEKITREQYVRALTAFMAELGLDPQDFYFPMHLGTDEVSLIANVVTDADNKKVRADGRFGPAACLSVVLTIEVD